MARSRYLRLTSLALSNVLIPLAVLIFATGFFPYKPVLPGLATFEDVQEPGTEGIVEQPEAIFDRVVFMVVDALRSDFVYGYDSGFEFTQSLIRSGTAIPFTAHATPPTVTMPRIKAITTGSVPSFLDLILNFAESDTSSSLAAQDTWLAQLRRKGDGGKIIFYGDDTWLKLFPSEDFFARREGTSSFFVSDFTEVDLNVTRHVPRELAQDDWSGMVLHYLGLDHVGHKTGPQGPNMLPKQREMDGIVRLVYEAMEGYGHHAKTLLVLAGDHGMNAGGNHGGSGPGETEPALVFVSPRFKELGEGKGRRYECPTMPKERTEFHYYSKVEQSDIVPALAGMMGMPVSKNSLGVLTPELGQLWSQKDRLKLLLQNARQLLQIVRAKYGGGAFDQSVEEYSMRLSRHGEDLGEADGDEDRLVRQWAWVLHLMRHESRVEPEVLEKHLFDFLYLAQETMSDTASSYDIPRMVAGMATAAAALIFAVLSFPSFWPPSMAGIFLTVASLLYGVMMFASSYVEEEQHFWYWLTPIWITLLVNKNLRISQDTRSSYKMISAGLMFLITHRLAIRWNQTGQKHAGEPDIVHTFFPGHHILLWLLILATYIFNGIMLHQRSFAGLFMPELAAFAEVSVVFFAMVFKLNFTQADAPELVMGLAERIRDWSEPFSLVLQARAAFASMAVSAMAVVVLVVMRRRGKGEEDGVSLTERLHPLLTLFLMTQTRAPNVPLFLGLEVQRLALIWLLAPPRIADPKKLSSIVRPSSTQVAATALLLSYVYYFCMGGSNSISSIDLSNAYNGVADYNIAAVGILLFASNWSGPLWWCSAAALLCTQTPTPATRSPTPLAENERDWVIVEREKLHDDAVTSTKSADAAEEGLQDNTESWSVYVTCMTVFISTALLAVMAACTALRTHLFIWTVFSPKYLYALAWSLGWHLLVNIGLGTLLYRLCSVA